MFVVLHNSVRDFMDSIIGSKCAFYNLLINYRIEYADEDNDRVVHIVPASMVRFANCFFFVSRMTDSKLSDVNSGTRLL